LGIGTAQCVVWFGDFTYLGKGERESDRNDPELAFSAGRNSLGGAGGDNYFCTWAVDEKTTTGDSQKFETHTVGVKGTQVLVRKKRN